MVEWKGVEPGTPEAIARAKAYAPPKAIIKEAPPVKAPKPPPPPPPKPPTLEPVIPQPYVPPVGGKVIARDAKGNPTVLQTPDGKKHYTPYQTVMWGSLGFATERDYILSQKTGIPSQYVGITAGVEKPVRVSRAEMVKVGMLRGEEQFDALKKMGVIPFGSKFMPGREGYRGKDWSYIPPDEIKRVKGRLLATQAASVIEPGISWKFVPTEEGIEGVVPEGSPVNEFAKNGILNLNDAVEAGYTKVSDYEGWDVSGAQIDKIIKRTKALELLADRGYKGYGDNYRVVDALVSDDPKVKEALETVFSEKDLASGQKWIDKNWGIAPGRPGRKEVIEAYRKLTPWEEGKGETLEDYLKEQRRKIPVDSPLSALIPGLIAIPSPHAKAVLLALIAGTIGYGVVKTAIEVGKDPVPAALKKASATFASQFERSPMPEDLVLVTSKGMAMGIKDIDPAKRRLPGVSIVPIDPKIPALFPRDLRQQIPGITITKIDPKIPPISTKKVEPALYLPTPMITMDELTGLQAGMIKAVAEVAVAEEGLKTALPKTQTIPIDWNKILEEAQKAKRKEDIEKIFATSAFKFLPGVPPDVSAHFHRNYQAYLRKMAILNDAKKSYVASLNPTPVMGKATDEAMGLASSYMLAQSMGLSKPKEWEQPTPYLIRVLGTDLERIAKVATATSIKALAKALAQGKTATQAATQALAATQTAIQTQVNTLTKNMALTQTQTKALTRAIAVTATHTAIATATATGVMTIPMAATATAALTATATPAKPILPIIPLIPKPGASDEEKREFVNAQQGIVAYRRGALRGKSRWLVFYHPYGKDDKLELYGAPPRGAMHFEGKGSAKKTAVVLRGKPPAKPISIDTGAVDDIIRSKDGKITLEHVKDVSAGKEVYRKGGITLSEKEVTKKGRTRVKELRDVLVRDAGGGVEETKNGRRHIKL